ncbi:hypothetical protein GCK32_007900, partial [Trichostrongylus colubriformis]
VRLQNPVSSSDSTTENVSHVRKQRALSTPVPVYFESKYMLLYLYYGAILLMRRNELRRAISLLESAILIPGSATTVAQLDALKK